MTTRREPTRAKAIDTVIRSAEELGIDVHAFLLSAIRLERTVIRFIERKGLKKHLKDKTGLGRPLALVPHLPELVSLGLISAPSVLLALWLLQQRAADQNDANDIRLLELAGKELGSSRRVRRAAQLRTTISRLEGVKNEAYAVAKSSRRRVADVLDEDAATVGFKDGDGLKRVLRRSKLEYRGSKRRPSS